VKLMRDLRFSRQIWHDFHHRPPRIKATLPAQTKTSMVAGLRLLIGSRQGVSQ
jgi:hypothetical protein